jgi:hypothetical protein
VGFAFAGLGGDGEDGDAGCSGIQDKGDRLSLGVVVGQGNRARLVDLQPRPFGADSAVFSPVVEAFEQGVGAVDLVAGGGEVVADWLTSRWPDGA